MASLLARGQALPQAAGASRRRAVAPRALASVDFAPTAAPAPAPRPPAPRTQQPAAPASEPEVVLDAARGAEARPGLAALLSPRNVLLFNGRLAMMGFAAGALGELATHQPLGAQLAAAGPHAAAAWVLLAAASAAPLLRGVLEGDEVFGPFNPASEMLNGKVAIAGLLALLAIEALKGSALL